MRRKERLLGPVLAKAEAVRARIAAELARAEASVRAIHEEVEIVDFLTPDGRYDRSREAGVGNRGFRALGLSSDGEVERRGRGRPRKYAAGAPRPARPTRAKTEAGIERARKGLNVRRARVASMVAGAAMVVSAMISPVTASPARAVVPKAAAEIGRELLVGTIAAQQDVVAPVEVEIVATEDALVAEPVKAPAFDLGAIAARQRSVMEAALLHLGSEDDVSEDVLALRSIFLSAHKAQTQIHRMRPRGEAGVARLDYDFSDAMDEAKAPADVRARFAGFGLVTDPPSGEFTEEELQLWMKRAIFNGVDYPAADYDRYMRDFRSATNFHDSFDTLFGEVIDRERKRVLVWPLVECRLHFVEQTYDRLMQGKIDLDTAMVRTAYFDFFMLDTVRYGSHRVYREIVDAMKWFEGFSRLDIAAWSGHDPDKVPYCRSIYGFPGWTFPERLHDAVFDGHLFEEPIDVDYAVPSMKEMVEFLSTDKELMIASLRSESGFDYADIDL